jgi:CRISPR-associated protein Csd1
MEAAAGDCLPAFKGQSFFPVAFGSSIARNFIECPLPGIVVYEYHAAYPAERNINRGKAGIIKAYLIKNKNKEELTVSLDEHNHDKSYVLGRLFAALEKAQQDANPGLNVTIKDKYFTSACATPASIFPTLLKLSNHHIRVAKRAGGFGYVSEKRIEDLIVKLNADDNPFPAHLTLEEQGLFVVGYYHQRNANYRKTEKENKNDTGNQQQI